MAVNAEKQAAIVNAILRQQNDNAVRETRTILVRIPPLDSLFAPFTPESNHAPNCHPKP